MAFIDPMTEDDVAAVVAIDGATVGSSGWDEAQVRGELTRSWARLWVVREEQAELHASVRAFLCAWLVADELHILNVATDTTHRRRGHAGRLLTHALRFAAEQGVRMLLLEVRRSNAPAIGLYRAFGFTAMGIRARYYGDGEDAVEMVLRLDELGQPLPGRDEVRLSRHENL
ncbi:MAG: GNAT family N-acetyltransferase [Myxococcales bacterium]|nr:GNAT family N-acetyltransferase [Myxococcales bacterium]